VRKCEERARTSFGGEGGQAGPRKSFEASEKPEGCTSVFIGEGGREGGTITQKWDWAGVERH
jgi:hypothetical protein